MAEKTHEGLDLGLSEEEKADLENMISEFNADRSSLPPETSVDDLQTRVSELNQKIAHLGEIVLKINKRIDAFYEIIQLIHQKSEIMNKRVDTVIESTQAYKDI